MEFTLLKEEIYFSNERIGKNLIRKAGEKNIRKHIRSALSSNMGKADTSLSSPDLFTKSSKEFSAVNRITSADTALAKSPMGSWVESSMCSKFTNW